MRLTDGLLLMVHGAIVGIVSGKYDQEHTGFEGLMIAVVMQALAIGIVGSYREYQRAEAKKKEGRGE